MNSGKNMRIQGRDILYSNFEYDPRVYYFLYIGDLKNYALNYFVRETLEKRLAGRDVQFVAIVPDVCFQYNFSNIMVINPVARDDMISDHTFSNVQAAPKMSCRISGRKFMAAVSENEVVLSLIETILQHQDEIYINLYESLMEMTLDSLDRVILLGPDKRIARKYNDKIVQFRELKGIVPLIDGAVCRGVEELMELTGSLRKKWQDGIFVSCAFSAAGANSAVTRSQEEVAAKFTDDAGEYLVTRYIPHDLDPTVLAVVANENDVYIAGVADQTIIDGNRFVGSHFPSVTTSEQQQKLKDYTVAVGRLLGGAGYRGIFGCDYLIDQDGNIYFLEINARKQGTTLEFCFTLEQNLPKGSPMLPELEYYAVMENRFPQRTVEMKENSRGIHWGTYNYKVMEELITSGYIPQNPYERETFHKVANGELVKDFVILEHLGTNLKVKPGTFLSRVVSVGRCRDDVDEGLCQGVGFIKQTIQNRHGFRKERSMREHGICK
jgi:hypothetical protein